MHLGTKNVDFQMERYTFKRRADGEPHDPGPGPHLPRPRSSEKREGSIGEDVSALGLIATAAALAIGQLHHTIMGVCNDRTDPSFSDPPPGWNDGTNKNCMYYMIHHGSVPLRGGWSVPGVDSPMS